MITMNSFGNRHRFYHESRHAETHNTKIDMTPMVAVAFLLLAFLLVTVNIKKQNAVEIIMPVATLSNDIVCVRESKTFTFILSDSNKVYWYQGLEDPQLNLTDFSPTGLRKFLLERNQDIYNQVQKLQKQYSQGKISIDSFKILSRQAIADKDGIIVLIKTDKKAKFVNVVDMLDEISNCKIGRYALVDISPYEEKLVADYNASLCKK